MSFSHPFAQNVDAWWRTFLLAWSFERFLLGMMVLLTFATGAMMGVQSDTWWQIRTGQLILQSGQIPTTDPFSSTVRGGYWPNHEWLAQVLFYLWYTLGGLPMLLIACASLVTLTWAGVYLLCDGPPRVRVFAILLGLVGQAAIWSARPHIFSLAMLVIVLLFLPHRRWHWLYPILFLLWANIHAGVAFGGVVLVSAFVVALACDRGQALHWLLVGSLSFLATLLNPLGWHLWVYVLNSLHDVTRPYLMEWQPPNLRWPVSYPFFILVILCAASVLHMRKHWNGHRDWTLLLLALIFAYLGFRSIRHTAFFGIVALPLMMRQFRSMTVGTQRTVATGLVHVLLLLALTIGAVGLVYQNWATTPAQPLPLGTVAAVRRCQGTLYNTYDLGGPLIWLVPERAVFIDNRQDPYPSDLLFRAVRAEQDGLYQDLFREYNIACALVPMNQQIYTVLRRDGWEELNQDGALAVLRRP